ncbi:low molecular weight protein-tyrosine-phosphatase [Rhodoferax saidenbachensis]|uniref:Protein-tyrosine phosphatase n=1 Tax=Rhodoferax saidenbachensis TaxID=1484693 RepID=A0ABU1ZMN8_9BURK|nr:low molecular weight protein-tyrosine-phosphatase [Rhodoferax saidenbachensis]MDR7306802.1 protein-tyrosine phosphatase [Rhodoferax saidenbachensis]
MPDYRLLFVCMGNICRSPTAHGVMCHKVLQRGWQDRVLVDSAGTHNYHPGEAPDPRSQTHAARRGYDLSDLPPAHQAKLRRLTEFCQRHDSPEVPDPYYGGSGGFDTVLDLVEDACDGLLLHVQRELN